MNTENKKVLAFDFGASSGRAILGYIKDGEIDMEEIHRFSNDSVKIGATLYWDTLRQFYEIKQGILKAKQKGGFDSLAIDTWGVDFGLLDKQGILLENAVHYRDERTVGTQKRVFKKVGKRRIYNETGIQFNDFNTVFQLYSLTQERPELLERAENLLLTPDLFNYFLTGHMKTEYTMATTTQLLSAKDRVWYQELFSKLGIKESLFPEIIPSGTIVGTIKEDICEELGIEPAKVIAVASHDTASAVVAVPTQEEDFVFISCGTWSLFGAEMLEPLIDDITFEMNVSNEGGYGNKYLFLKNIIGLWLAQESRRQWIREGREYDFGTLEKMALEVTPFQSFIDPDAPQFHTVGDIPSRIRAYCEESGQKVPQTEGEIMCCINQSLAFKYRYTLEQIEACTGKRYNEIHMIGGGIQSNLLCQMTASACDRKVIAGPVEATALGNIAVQLIALGEIKDLKEARSIIERSEYMCKYFPQDNLIWDYAYERFLKKTKLKSVYKNQKKEE